MLTIMPSLTWTQLRYTIPQLAFWNRCEALCQQRRRHLPRALPATCGTCQRRRLLTLTSQFTTCHFLHAGLVLCSTPCVMRWLPGKWQHSWLRDRNVPAATTAMLYTVLSEPALRDPGRHSSLTVWCWHFASAKRSYVDIATSAVANTVRKSSRS